MRKAIKKNWKKLEHNELSAMGITDEAIEANYSDTDFDYYLDDENQEVYECQDGNYEVDWCWSVDCFKMWFNEVE